LSAINHSLTSTYQQFGHPNLIFFCELTPTDLHHLLVEQEVINTLVTHGYGVALALRDLNDQQVENVRLLNHYGVPLIAWLLLPPGEGAWFHLQNYPQAIERYRAFRAWADPHHLGFLAVGLDIEPPPGEMIRLQRFGIRDFVRRIWQARENVLFAAARAAYNDLIAEIHHDGYEVHIYQLPILADDRRAGTSLVQRAFDIVDLPADAEILMCYSSIPINRINNDLGGALIGSYGPDADGIGVGSVGPLTLTGSGNDDLPPLPWEALERDLLLAAQHTDTIYIYSLEGCTDRHLLARIAAINWDAEPPPTNWKRTLVSIIRAAIFSGLLLTRYQRTLIAWLGWGLAAVLLTHRFQNWVRRNTRPE
jgi:hypothetical protein